MTSSQTSLLIVDDHELYCEGLSEIISRWPEFNIVGSANSGREAERMCDELEPDLVLMDVQMPDQNGIETARKIKRKHPKTVLVMLTVSGEKHYLLDSLQSGATGYLMKNVTGQRLRDGLRSALHGEIVLSGGVSEQVSNIAGNALNQDSGSSSPRKTVEGFSERDVQILKLLAQGCSNEEISESLFISVGMVKKYVAALMQELHVDNRVKLAIYAHKAGLAE